MEMCVHIYLCTVERIHKHLQKQQKVSVTKNSFLNVPEMQSKGRDKHTSIKTAKVSVTNTKCERYFEQTTRASVVSHLRPNNNSSRRFPTFYSGYATSVKYANMNREIS